MEASHLKNIIVLKNLPSNIVEEAIVVLKTNKKVKKLETVDQKKNKNRTESGSAKKGKSYILKEAEMLVNSYVSKIENVKKDELKVKNERRKYKKLKIYSITITIVSIVLVILNLL